jgi:hypothetical protein
VPGGLLNRVRDLPDFLTNTEVAEMSALTRILLSDMP